MNRIVASPNTNEFNISTIDVIVVSSNAITTIVASSNAIAMMIILVRAEILIVVVLPKMVTTFMVSLTTITMDGVVILGGMMVVF